MNRPKLSTARRLAVASLAIVALLASAWLVSAWLVDRAASGATAELADEGVLTMLIRRFTREESVSIRIDERRRMRVDRHVATSSGDGRAASGPQPAFSDDWLVLDHRWLGTGRRVEGWATSYVGASMGTDGHVTVTPPFVVLTRGEESILLRMESGRTVSVDEPMPSWVRSDPDSGLLLARFDGFGDAAIGDGTVRLQRRFFHW